MHVLNQKVPNRLNKHTPKDHGGTVQRVVRKANSLIATHAKALGPEKQVPTDYSPIPGLVNHTNTCCQDADVRAAQITAADVEPGYRLLRGDKYVVATHRTQQSAEQKMT